MAGHQLVQLAARARVLILEARGAARLRLHQRVRDLVVDRAEDLTRAREEAHHSREPVRDRGGAGTPQCEWLGLARDAIPAPRRHAFTPQRPQLIREVLLQERNLGLHREHDVR